MKQLLHALAKEMSLLGRAVIIAGLVVGGVAYANTFVQPSQNPPGGNVPAPVHIGNTAQAKSGNFAAAALAGLWVQGTEGFCIGPNDATGGQRDCISSWPSVGNTEVARETSLYVARRVGNACSAGRGRSCTTTATCPAGSVVTGYHVDNTHAFPKKYGCYYSLSSSSDTSVSFLVRTQNSGSANTCYGTAHVQCLSTSPISVPPPPPTPDPIIDDIDYGDLYWDDIHQDGYELYLR